MIVWIGYVDRPMPIYLTVSNISEYKFIVKRQTLSGLGMRWRFKDLISETI